MIVSNIGVDPGFSAIYTTNSAMHTAFVQVGLKEGHRVAATSTWPDESAHGAGTAGTGGVLFIRQPDGCGV